jgi:hypothetical protein
VRLRPAVESFACPGLDSSPPFSVVSQFIPEISQELQWVAAAAALMAKKLEATLLPVVQLMDVVWLLCVELTT